MEGRPERSACPGGAGISPFRIEPPPMKTPALALLGLLAAAVGLGPGAPAAAQTWDKPFSPRSIWNTKIGKNPRYVSCGLGVLAAMCNDREGLYRAKPGDPLRPVARPDGLTTNPPVPVPETLDLLVEPNDGKAFLLSDGLTVREYVLWQHKGLSKLEGWHFGDHRLDGDGILGGHGGSGMSVLGGSLRVGELEARKPIAHALKLELDWAVLYRDPKTPASQSQTYRWPAVRSDGNPGGSGPGPNYTGTNPALKMGSLLALPRRVEIKKLGLSPNGLKLAKTLQEYGAYLVDTTGNHWKWDNGGYTASLCVERGASPGYLHPNNNYLNNDLFYRDFAKIYPLLAVIDDNAADTIGGGRKE